MLAPGVPVVYYGDEIGMSGADAPDNRRDMRFSGLNPNEARVRATVIQLAQLRGKSMAALYGQTTIVSPDQEAFVLRRNYLDEELVLVLNLSGDSRTVKLPAQLDGTDWQDIAGVAIEVNGSLQVPANGFVVLQR